jgi:hyperosmotically inducible periplasmic protein
MARNLLRSGMTAHAAMIAPAERVVGRNNGMQLLQSARRTLLVACVALLATGSAYAATSDAWITTKAKMALLTTEGVSTTAVNVDTMNGLVTLHGKIGSDVERQKAETAVRGIDGVKSVRNLLQVVPEKRETAMKESDDKIKARVETAMKSNAAFKDVSVQSVNSGVVLLAGNVETLGDHLSAVERAARVPGVKRVASEIKSPDKLADNEIYADKPETTASAGSPMSDMWITSAVKMRLMADERTPALDVNVDTTDGAVTLFGMVPTAKAKTAAEEDAHKVSGVKTVANQLEVVPKKQETAVRESDDRVKDNVEQALRSDDALRGDSIDIEVSNGVARLTGTVDQAADRLRAAAVARTAAGVRAVRDDLAVASTGRDRH